MTVQKNASLTGAFFALVRRDLLLAFRRRSELLFPVFFLMVVVSLFPLGVGPSPELLARIAPGVVWIAALLSVVISLDSVFRSDFEDGTLEQYIVSGQPLSLIALA
ncbi:MAG TPA: heme exporter protein CcmB, partial [Xanthomonadales bacterium]|nr:heme exporter protein CcmB [Xanthomonadales bacterium]